MVQDIAYEQLSIPAMLSTVYLNVISTQIKNKVHFDILLIKPIEFAQNCTVPCVFIIGKQDKLVLPKRVTQIFEAYKGKQKQILSSCGQHSSEREPHIIKQCQDFILQELRKNSYNNRRTLERNERFSNQVSGNFLNNCANAFEDKYRVNGGRSFGNGRRESYKFGMKYNFETYLDESRNEERSAPSQASFSTFDTDPRASSYYSANGSSAAKNQMPSNVEITDEEFQQYLKKMNDLIKTEKI